MAYTTINKSTDYFNTKLFTGNGGTQSLTGVGFQPDWVWLKSRSVADSHILFDAVRGVTKRLMSNAASAESTEAQEVQSFDSDGFTVGNSDNANRSSATMVSWNWKAGTGQGSSNTDGSINTTYTSANTTAGFSISKYTGTGSTGTIGHGLGAEPEVIIVKKLNSSESWFSYHKPLGNTGRLVLNATDGVATDAGYWNSTTPTSSVFSVTSNGSNNASGDTYMAYCFAPKTGYSKFGSYTGNGNADGTFVYTGFKPAWVMVKKATGAANSWFIGDNKRSPSNIVFNYLLADTSDVDESGSGQERDFLSNGFKIRNSNNGLNTSGETYIYMSCGQSLVGQNNVPCTAR